MWCKYRVAIDGAYYIPSVSHEALKSYQHQLHITGNIPSQLVKSSLILNMLLTANRVSCKTQTIHFKGTIPFFFYSHSFHPGIVCVARICNVACINFTHRKEPCV